MARLSRSGAAQAAALGRRAFGAAGWPGPPDAVGERIGGIDRCFRGACQGRLQARQLGPAHRRIDDASKRAAIAGGYCLVLLAWTGRPARLQYVGWRPSAVFFPNVAPVVHRPHLRAISLAESTATSGRCGQRVGSYQPQWLGATPLTAL